MVASSLVNNNVHLVFFALVGVPPLCRQRVRVLSFAEQRAAERLESGNLSTPRFCQVNDRKAVFARKLPSPK